MVEPELVLGPALRHVDDTSATVWVETDRPCTVRVAGAAERTFCVGGHHYALVTVRGLAPDSSVPYTVELDGRRVWPEDDSPFPPCRIRTLGPDRTFRILFGSCRRPFPLSRRQRRRLGGDALNGYAERMADRSDTEWPDALLLLGDQVYADETSPRTRQWLRQRRDTRRPPGLGVADFEEYTQLYREAWSDPEIRWLMSTVPTSMIFDDHDVHDDWNTSRAWRQRMAAQRWWPERIRGALVSYWIYQHLGNLAPADLAADPLFAQVREVGATGDALEVLRAFADRADAEVDGAKPTRWSYQRGFGPVRLVVIDTRCGRILDGTRTMVSDTEFDWIAGATQGDYRHLLIGSSLPWLLPPALHHVEAANELACDRQGWRGRLAERIRQLLDLEHWAAFRRSFDRLTDLLGAVARGQHTAHPPATVTVLSGDVHHSYLTRARYPEPTSAPVWQLTCSPVHNDTPALIRLVFRVAWANPATRIAAWWARHRGRRELAVRWARHGGPTFHNQIACLEISGDHAAVTLESDHPNRPALTTSLTDKIKMTR
jgi:hypothetical protein